jgi:hypothetical protein
MPNKKVKAKNVFIFLKFGSNLKNLKNYIVFKILNKKVLYARQLIYGIKLNSIIEIAQKRKCN